MQVPSSVSARSSVIPTGRATIPRTPTVTPPRRMPAVRGNEHAHVSSAGDHVQGRGNAPARRRRVRRDRRRLQYLGHLGRRRRLHVMHERKRRMHEAQDTLAGLERKRAMP
jgi:hypothetical protein